MTNTIPAVTMPEKKRRRILTQDEVIAFTITLSLVDVGKLRDRINEEINRRKDEIRKMVDSVES